MSGNFNEPPEGGDLIALDALARELRIGVGLAEGRVQRLMGEIFSSPQTAESGMRTLIQRGGLEHALAVLEQDSIRRAWHFGGLRIGLLPWRRRTVHAALAQLPEALRDLQQLLDRRHDLERTRSQLLLRVGRRPDDDPDRPRGRPRGRGR